MVALRPGLINHYKQTKREGITMELKYKKFQQWLNECPVHIRDYQDHSDHAIVIFDLPLEPEKDDE